MIWLIVIIGCFAISYFLLGSIENDKQKNGIQYSTKYQGSRATYLGGYPDIEGGKKADITVKNNALLLEIKGGHNKTIFPKDLIDAKIQSHQQIVNDISIGKVLAFGVFALGIPNQKTTVKNYTVITVQDNGQRRDLIFEVINNEQLVRSIKNIA